jgi:hypothetical protein
LNILVAKAEGHNSWYVDGHLGHNHMATLDGEEWCGVQ